MKILIVDDNVIMRDGLKNLFNNNGNELSECGNGKEAVAALGISRYDWVLMDVRLKELDGISAARIITEKYPDTRVVIVTDYDDDMLRSAARRAGAYAYILKEKLIELITIVQPWTKHE